MQSFSLVPLNSYVDVMLCGVMIVEVQQQTAVFRQYIVYGFMM